MFRKLLHKKSSVEILVEFMNSLENAVSRNKKIIFRKPGIEYDRYKINEKY